MMPTRFLKMKMMKVLKNNTQVQILCTLDYYHCQIVVYKLIYSSAFHQVMCGSTVALQKKCTTADVSSSSKATTSTVTDKVNVALVIDNESVAYMKTCYAYVTM